MVTLDKYVGEMDVEETKILVDPEIRNIQQVSVEDAIEAERLFEELMGESASLRKNFIQAHSAEAIYQI